MKKNNFDLSLKIGAKKLHDSRKKFYRAANRYHNKFLNKNGMIKENYLENRLCPLCKNKGRFLFYKNGGTYKICDNCEMIYLDPCFKDFELVKYYKNMHNMQSTTIKNEEKFYKKIYNYGLSLIKKNIGDGQNKNILDIGCSSGLFLDLAKKNFKTYGIELNKKEYKLVKKKHFVWNINYADLNDHTNLKFNIITMWDVIEHIKNIEKLMVNIKKFLKPEGFFFFQTPNSQSLASRILKEKCNLYDGIEHVNLFNFKNIELLAKKFGFKMILAESVISEIPVINNYINFRDIYHGKNIKQDLEIINEKNIHRKKLGYKMQVLFKSLK